MFISCGLLRDVSRLILILFLGLFFLVVETSADENKESRRCLKTLKGANGTIFQMDFSNDGKYLLTSSTNNTVVLWDVTTGEYLYRFNIERGLQYAKFIDNGKHFITFRFEYGYKTNAELKKWDTKSKECIDKQDFLFHTNVRTKYGYNKEIHNMYFCNDALLITKRSNIPNCLTFWEMPSGEPLSNYELEDFGLNNISTLCSSSNGKKLAISFWYDTKKNDQDGNKIFNNITKIVNTKTGKSSELFRIENLVNVSCLSNSGSILAYSTAKNKKIIIWDITQKKILQNITFKDKSVNGLIFSESDDQLFCCIDGAIKVYDVQKGLLITTYNYERKKDNSRYYNSDDSSSISSIALSNSNWVIASAYKDSAIKLWNLASQELLRTINCKNKVNSFVVEKETDLIVGDDSKNLKLINGSKISEIDGHKGDVYSVDLSPDKELIATGSKDKMVRLWKTEDTDKNRTLEGHKDDVYCVKFSPDSKIVASGSKDGTIKFWDCKELKCLDTLKHADRVYSIDFSPDGEFLISGGKDKKIKIWDLKNYIYHSSLEGHTGSVYSVCFSPDGKLVASGSSDESIKIWNFEKKEEKATLKGHTGSVKSIIFSKDGKYLISGSSDKTVKVWNVESGNCLKTLLGHNEDVNCVCLSEDNKTVYSGSDDGTIKLWNVEKILK